MDLINRIKWIKNVKRNKGTGWAYNEATEEEGFLLAFGLSHAGGADKPKEKDVIVIFQTIEDQNIAIPGTYLTHLVEVDSIDTTTTSRADYPIGRHVTVLAKSNPITKLKSNEIGLSFEDVNTGQLCNFDTFNKKLSPNENRKIILKLFQGHFRHGILNEKH